MTDKSTSNVKISVAPSLPFAFTFSETVLPKSYAYPPEILLPADDFEPALTVPGPPPLQLVNWNVITSRDAWYMKAKKFVELVDSGMNPNNAAIELNTKVETIQKTRGQVEDDVRRVIETYGGMAPEVRRLLARATQNKILLDAQNSDDPKMLKLALEASKAIGEDSEVSIYQGKNAPQPAAMPILPPALAALLEPPQEVIDVTPSEEKKDD